jgi:PTS system N-acetylgalactosamine-specific IIA component
MFGIVITGHGEYATGMANAVKLLTGGQDVIGINFKANESESDLKKHLNVAVEKFNEYEHIFILCDILGGSPFKNAVTLFNNKENIHILYGINLGIAVELCMQSQLSLDFNDSNCYKFIEEIVDTGKKQIGYMESK